MTDTAILDELRTLRRLVESLLQRDTLTPAQRRVLRAVAAVYAPGETFSTAEVAAAAGGGFGQRDELRQALRQACNMDVRRLGILLRQVADAGAVVDGARLVALPCEAGARRWALEGIESL